MSTASDNAAASLDDVLVGEAVLGVYRQMFAALARDSGAVVDDPGLVDVAETLLAAFAGRRVEQPALFIGAEHDVIFGQTREGVDATRAAVPQLQQVWIDGSGHWVQQERPDEVNAALLAFLAAQPRW